MPGESAAIRARARGLARLIGSVIGMVGGVLYGTLIVGHSGGVLSSSPGLALAGVLATGVAISSALALAMPLISIDPFVWLRAVLERARPAELVGAVAGLVAALVISALVAVLLSGLPWGTGAVISMTLACVLVYVGVIAGRRRGDALAALFLSIRAAPIEAAPEAQDGEPIVVDTSVLIDGRVLEVAAAGFIQGRLLIPDFVLQELQEIADSSSEIRRAKGRRGLDVVARLRDGGDVVCQVTEGGASTGEVDSRLVSLARTRRASLMTTDYNLDRVARLAGVRVLNLNMLASALKPAVVAGEPLTVAIIKDGREANQGVGYLEDGTMVVVENGRGHRGAPLLVTVNKVLQTASGRIVFAAAPPAAEARSAATTQAGRR